MPQDHSEGGFAVTETVTDGIERVSCLPDNRNDQPPILFVHGMWHAAWCWRDWQAQLATALRFISGFFFVKQVTFIRPRRNGLTES